MTKEYLINSLDKYIEEKGELLLRHVESVVRRHLEALRENCKKYIEELFNKSLYKEQ